MRRTADAARNRRAPDGYGRHGYASNRLDATAASPEVVAELRERFRGRLVNRDGKAPVAESVRVLEKTPKNALRVPFIDRAFPQAHFVYLYRDVRETLASMARWYGSVVLGILGGIAIALVWAIAAYGAQGFWDAIVVRQTVGRVARSFAHARPFWWYLMVLPPMLLPWTLTLRAPWRAWRDGLLARKSTRFGLAWFVPALIVFCFFSGKQMHYLLPLLPGLALYLAVVLGADGARLRSRWYATLLLVAGIGLAALPYLAGHAQEIGPIARMDSASASTEHGRRRSHRWPCRLRT